MRIPRRSGVHARRRQTGSRPPGSVLFLALAALVASPMHARAECTPAFRISMIDSLPIEPNDNGMGAVSLRLDATGSPRVAHKLHDGPLRYASQTPAGWQVETAYPTDEGGCSLMLDSTGEPHILFFYGILSRSGSTWVLNRHRLYVIDHAQSVMAPDGSAHAVVLQSFGSGGYIGLISHVLIRDSIWTETQLETRDDAFMSPNASVSIRLDAGAMPRFCVTNTNTPEIRCWERIDAPPLPTIPHARWGSLAIDAQDVSHLAYYDTQSHHLQLAVYRGGSWSTTPVDTDGDVGAHASLAIDRSGGIHIAYYDRDEKDLEYAFRAPGTETWSRCTVDAPGDVGSFASLEVDANGTVHIAYWDATTRHVKHATTGVPVAVQPTSWSGLKSTFR